ncbi:MAG TPA: protein kinase [Candidatus Sulfotelmatobacter sp.]|nr:protein kinase [Candidatus Sulfotelmatobacter sp.]
MRLTSGTRLGPYEVQSPLGAGGMGEVYRALDTRLSRTVAVKVLAANLSSSPELKQRMEREARAISSLSHPHICQLYDIGSHDGADFLVMEFLEGETLAERLRKGPIALPEMYKIGIAIAEALAAAHARGIVHRDLKPGNIMLTQGGAKLMDFGLAKPLGLQSTMSGSVAAPSFTAAATLSGPSPLSPLTTAGTIIGTIQYMSPEQIEGKEADARSDIFAFGAVLYEMAAGKRPFEGKSQLSLASSILEKDPDPICTLKPQTPAAFEHVITTCLRKNPEERYFAAHDIKLELQFLAAERTPTDAAGPAPPPRGAERGAWLAAVLFAVLLGIAAGLLMRRPAQTAQSIRTMIDAPLNTVLSLSGDFAGPPVLSPDGNTIAFTATATGGKPTIWVRPLGVLEARALPGTEGAIFPFWSWDSRALGFFTEGKLETIDLDGGSPQLICDAPFARGGAWTRDGNIIFSPNTQMPLMRVSINGGTPTPLTVINTSQHTSHRWPFLLPDGKHFLYLAIHHDTTKAANNTVYYASLDGKENRPLLRSQTNAVYAAGFILIARGDQLMAQPFDPDKGALSGESRILARGVMNDVTTWHMDASANENGLIVYGSGGNADLQLVWFDRSGKKIGTIADKFTSLMGARISPQGDRVALQIDVGINDIWVLDLARGVRTRLTFGPVQNTGPVWSPDGKWIAYASVRNGHSNLYRTRSDGSGTEEVLLSNDEADEAQDWSRDGKYLLYSRGGMGMDAQLWAVPLEGEHKPWLVVPHAAVLYGARLSPDGHWLAYESNESGTVQLYIVPFRGGQGKWQVTSSGSSIPAWSADGKELFYMDPGFNLYVLTFKEVDGVPQLGAPQQIPVTPSAPTVFYDISPDGKKILIDNVAQQVSPSVTVVTNFTAALKK